MSGVVYVIARVYVMMFEVCQQCFVLLSRVYVMKFEVMSGVIYAIVPCLCNEV